MSHRKKIGVVCFQLGGPDSLQAVEPFLLKLFCDPDIIPLPMGWLLRKPLAKFIVWRRAEVVREHYAEIGGKSPIRELTARQAAALEKALAPRADARVTVAMRYWHPSTAEALAELHAAGVDELVLLPLYPHYSFATTRSSLREWNRLYVPDGKPVHTVEHFYDHSVYIEALADNVSLTLSRFGRPQDAVIVFSAHGLPVSYIEAGDPYQRHIEATVRLVMERGKWPNRHVLCYQSKVGRARWLEPSLLQTLERLAHSGQKHLLVCPVAFVTEHIETLHEINIEAREEAERYGVEQFEMVPALNDSPKFISALADAVLRAAGISS